MVHHLNDADGDHDEGELAEGGRDLDKVEKHALLRRGKEEEVVVRGRRQRDVL